MNQLLVSTQHKSKNLPEFNFVCLRYLSNLVHQCVPPRLHYTKSVNETVALMPVHGYAIKVQEMCRIILGDHNYWQNTKWIQKQTNKQKQKTASLTRFKQFMFNPLQDRTINCQHFASSSLILVDTVYNSWGVTLTETSLGTLLVPWPQFGHHSASSHRSFLAHRDHRWAVNATCPVHGQLTALMKPTLFFSPFSFFSPETRNMKEIPCLVFTRPAVWPQPGVPDWNFAMRWSGGQKVCANARVEKPSTNETAS